MQPDAQITSIAHSGRRTVLAAALLSAVLLALLAHQHAWWPFHQRRTRPFARAYRELRKHARCGGARTPALVLLHRAFDAAAGQRLLAADIPAFVRARPALTGCRDAIERFFAASRGQFFFAACAAADDVDGVNLSDLLDLARMLAAAERRSVEMGA